jgi:uncharacterized membrane protein
MSAAKEDSQTSGRRSVADYNEASHTFPPAPPDSMPTFKEIVEGIGLFIDAAGVLAILLGLALATLRFAGGGCFQSNGFRQFRQDLGRGILLGLEFLVAADIVRTVAVTPTLEGVLVLGLIVLIRTFLSMSLQVELEGRWPWQRGEEPARSATVAEGKLATQRANI